MLNAIYRFVRGRFSVISLVMALGIVAALLLIRLLSALPVLHGLVGDLLLFVPANLWILLFLIFAAGSFIGSFSWKRTFVVIFAATLLLNLLGFHWPLGRQSYGGEVIRVVTSNRGQNQGASLWPFIDQVQADVIVLQQESSTWSASAGGRGQGDAPWYFERLRPFAVHSRFPIIEAKPLKSTKAGRQEIRAARFVLELNSGQQLAIYSVHFPSLRDLLQPLRGVFWIETLKGRGLFSGDYWSDLNAYVDRREEVLQAVLSRLDREELPFIIAGDFNCPPSGSIYRKIDSVAEDAFAHAGQGFGWTFPGESRHALALYGPVLRIDYIFASSALSIHRAEVEADSPAQHRGVFTEVSID